MRGALVVVLMFAGLIFAGCGQSDKNMDTLVQQAKNQEERLRDLEQENRELKADMENLQEWYVGIKREMNTLTETRMGSKEEVERIVKDIVEQEMAAIEPRREEQRAEQRRQWRQRAEELRVRMQEEMAETLKLNEAQKEQFEDILAKTQQAVRDTFQKMRDGGDFDREKMRDAMENLRLQTDKDMKEILSAEQFEEYQKYQERILGAYMGSRGGRRRDR